jgi:hypothetical protein
MSECVTAIHYATLRVSVRFGGVVGEENQQRKHATPRCTRAFTRVGSRRHHLSYNSAWAYRRQGMTTCS